MSSTEMDRATRGAPFIVRYRIILTWIPALAFLIAILLSRGSLSETFLGEVVETVGYILIALATMGRIWCGIYIAGRKNKELCQDGPYSLCRNPLYVFSFFGMLGVAVGARAYVVAGIATVAFWIYYTFVIRSEEELLSQLFGSEFEAYKTKAPAVWPNFSNYWTREEFMIRPKRVIASMIDAAWFLWLIVLIELMTEGKKIFYLGS